MANFVERRKYQRCDSLSGDVRLSTDKKRWTQVELCDISASGLKFKSRIEYTANARLHFNITLFNMLSEFNIKMEGHIVRVVKERAAFSYVVKFENTNKLQQVQLDELIRSKISLADTPHPSLEREVSAFARISDGQPYK